ncbi:MAG TPA: protein kinase family protein [Pseudonocardiaceae bacterium]|nr:protein kinase family protein [Pseudonocardiaceae bacterium]
MSGPQPGREAPERPAAVLTPGALIAGRYRLLEQVGADGRVPASLWRAKDIVLERDVALTLLIGHGLASAKRTLDLATATARLEHPGITRVLDVLDGERSGSGLAGLVVSEWITGASLASLAQDAEREHRVLPSGVIARALAPLASAIDAAHRAGLVLGCDHPQRIWITKEGLAKLAFPAVQPLATQVGDVRGIGAALYLLLVGSWPLPDPPPGIREAPRTSVGAAVAPRALRPAVSVDLSILAERCLAGGSSGGIYTGTAVYQVLDQTATSEQDTVLMPMVAGSDPVDGLWHSVEDADHLAPDRRRKLAIALGVLGVATVIVLTWIGIQFANLVAGGDGTAPTIAVGQPSGAPASSAQQPARSTPVRPAEVSVFDPTGDPDNPNRVNRVIDGDVESVWKTYDYRQPFPALKPGVGVMASFVEPVKLGTVIIDSPSAGSKVEIRAAPSTDVPLDQTKVIGRATLDEGRTEIQIDTDQPSQHILVWITELSTAGGANATVLAELTFMRAG